MFLWRRKHSLSQLHCHCKWRLLIQRLCFSSLIMVLCLKNPTVLSTDIGHMKQKGQTNSTKPTSKHIQKCQINIYSPQKLCHNWYPRRFSLQPLFQIRQVITSQWQELLHVWLCIHMSSHSYSLTSSVSEGGENTKQTLSHLPSFSCALITQLSFNVHALTVRLKYRTQA